MSGPPSPAADGPWLSVLIPAFNAAGHVEDALRSVLVQAGRDVEIVVLDDGSVDGTAACVQGIAPGRIHLIRHARNLGVGASRKRLVEDARGDYVWFLDADDRLAPGAIDGLRARLARRPVDLVLCDFRVLAASPFARRRRRTFARPARGRDTTALVCGVLAAGQLHAWSKIARRSLWLDAGFPARRCYEDMPAVARLLAAARDWDHVAEAWVEYRQRAGSLSRSLHADALRDHAHALGEVRATLEPWAAAPEARQALDYFLLRGHAGIARRLARLHPSADDVAAACRARFAEDIPDGGRAVLRHCLWRGWWLRAWRVRRALRRAGWRAPA